MDDNAPRYKAITPSFRRILGKTANKLVYTVLLVTAIRARAKSSGYVIVADVTPANEPAINRRPGVFL